MTLIVLLLLGGGAVVILSATQTDPATGRSLSIVKTIGQVWNDQITAPDMASEPMANTTASASAKTTTTTTGAGPGVPVALQGDAATAAYLASHRSL